MECGAFHIVLPQILVEGEGEGKKVASCEISS